MDEKEYYELFGLETPGEGAGESVTEPAEPSESGNSSGEKGTGAAEPSEEQLTGVSEQLTVEGQGQSGPSTGEGQGERQSDSSAPSEHPSTEGNQGEGQSPEENAAYAAARRKAEAERDAEIARVRGESQKYLDDAVKALGMKNPYTGEPITTKAQMDAYRERAESEQRERLRNKSGMSDEEFKGFVDALPEVRQARETRARAEEALRQAQMQKAQAVVEEQIREIQKFDPSIKDLGDLLKQPDSADFQGLIRRGYSFLDAYRVLHFDQIIQRQGQAAKQAAYTAAQGKNHLSRTEQRGAGSVPVPADVLEEYRVFFPDMPETDIQKSYNEFLKSVK